MENVDEIVSFYHFSERGLALPTCSFFRGLLYFYGLELQHLNLNSICHIAIFIHFCEAFLGIEPYWDLFRYLFRVKPQPTSKNPSTVGAPASSLGNKPAADNFPTNSAPIFLDGKAIGSTSETISSNYLKDLVNPLS
jgi:hypothetical protein